MVYKVNFKKGKKLIKITNNVGMNTVMITPKDLKTKMDPDIKVESKQNIEMKNAKTRQFLS